MTPHPIPALRPWSHLFQLLAICTLTLVLFTRASAAESVKSFDIPAGEAVDTLKQAAQQAGKEIMFPANTVSGVQTVALKGDFTPLAAFNRMLTGTGLVVVQDEKSGALTVRKATKAPETKNVESRQADSLAANSEAIVSLDAYQVSDTRPEPFSDRNVDAPRTVNDVQPYIIYNAKIIEESGAINMEDFLRTNLTMVNQPLTNTANTTSYGSSSNISMRGLNAAQTLVLVDGRRLPNVYVAGTTYQADLNGIPMSAIDRIEVLPSSASGIYGGSAIAGVINVILKKKYTGGEVRMTYDSPLDTDASIRTLNVSYGVSFEGGRSHLTLTGQYSDAHALTLGDRKDIFVKRVRQVLVNAPDFYWTPTNPFLGAGVNISSGTSANLVLKPEYGGQTLPSNYTNLQAGTSSPTNSASMGAGLLANAGSYNMNLAAVNSNGPATNGIFGFTPVTKGFSTSFDRQMLKNLDAFVQYNYSSNFATEDYNGHFTNNSLSIPAAAPTNPFTSRVVLKTPLTLVRPRHGTSLTRTLATGVSARLPGGWIGQFDYMWSQNSAGTFIHSVDTVALAADILSGAFNPFVDPIVYPTSLEKYAAVQNFSFRQTVNTLAARGAGELPALPWGTPTMNVRAERRLEGQKDGLLERVNPLTPAASSKTTYLGFMRDIRSANAEILVPLVARHRFPFIYSLEAQLAGGRDQYVVDTGTPTKVQNTSTGAITYGSPVLNGQAFRKEVIYTSNNSTLGVKYQPNESLIIRASTGTAFLPPTTAQLTKNPLPDSATTTVLDRKTNTSYAVQTLSGGNPNLTPQNSRSVNVGIIWQPKWVLVKGLRFEANYYKISQADAIGSLSAQQILNMEDRNPARVTRDATGKVTLIDASAINLYDRDINGWDFILDYRVATESAGTFTFKVRDSIVLHSKYQYSLTDPVYDVAGYPLENGAMKNRLNTSVQWEDVHWALTWNARYFDSYFGYGAAGGALSAQISPGADFGNYIRALGNRKVESQLFHDFIVGYNFGRNAASGRPTGSFAGHEWFNGFSIQLGIKNLFNKAPAFDTSPVANGLMSPYGDSRMRSAWLTIKRVF